MNCAQNLINVTLIYLIPETKELLWDSRCQAEFEKAKYVHQNKE